MKIVCVSVCFIGFLLVGDVFSWDWNEDEQLDAVSTEVDLTEDYPQYFGIHVHNWEGEAINPEENTINTGEERPKPDLETSRDEDEQPNTEGTDLGPLPDPDTLIQESNMRILAEIVDNILSDFKVQQDKISELEEANKRLILKIDSIEQQTKTNSIILSNVRQDSNESSKTTMQKVLHVFNRIMRVRTSASDIAVALRAESNTSGKNKPIVVRFTNFANKMRVLAASNRLSLTDMTVSSDYSELVAQRRVALVSYLQEARAEGRRAFILYDKLMVDGVSHTLEELRAQKETNEQVEMLEVVAIE